MRKASLCMHMGKQELNGPCMFQWYQLAWGACVHAWHTCTWAACMSFLELPDDCLLLPAKSINNRFSCVHGVLPVMYACGLIALSCFAVF